MALMFLPHFDVNCHSLLYRPMATWNLLVFKGQKQRGVNGDVLYAFPSKNQSRCLYNSAFHIIPRNFSPNQNEERQEIRTNRQQTRIKN